MDTDSDTSSLLTLSGSIRQYLYRSHGGRRTQAISEEYHWPCDAAAAKMELDLAAMCEQLYPNGLYWEPEAKEGVMGREVLSERGTEWGPPRVLDLGSGSTASWIIAMAERFPHVECIGVDLIPADLSYLPANLSIEIHDLLEGVPYPDDFFSLIHARATFSSFSSPSQPILSSLSRILRPGGILILEEPEDMLSPFHARSPSSSIYLARALERNKVRVPTCGMVSSKPRELHRLTWGRDMGGKVRDVDGFRKMDGGRVEELRMEIGLGFREGEGPPETQVGSLHRDLYLSMWEAESVAIGMGEELIRLSKQMDELVIPERDVGLYADFRVVWATKGGG